MSDPKKLDDFRPLRNGLGNILEGLILRSQDRLTDDDLKVMSSLSGMAALKVRQLATVSEHLGSLTCCDSEVGAFDQPQDLADLLWLVSGVASEAHALLEAAAMANALLHGRQLRAAGSLPSESPVRSQKKRSG